jgi:hypothetical protein
LAPNADCDATNCGICASNMLISKPLSLSDHRC